MQARPPNMLSSLLLSSLTSITREEEKKLALILNSLIENPDAIDFLDPVDWEELEIPDYPHVIKYPMNLLQVQEKFKSGVYSSVEEVLDHIQLVWDNCKVYNKEGPFFQIAEKMERSFKKMIKNYLPGINIIVPTKKPENPASSTFQSQPPVGNRPLKETAKGSSAPKRASQGTKTQQKTGGSGPSKQQPQEMPIEAEQQPELELEKPPKKQAVTKAKSSSSKVEHKMIEEEEPAEVSQALEKRSEMQSQEQPVMVVSSQEKSRFYSKLKQVTQQELAQVVDLVQQKCPEAWKDVGGGMFEFSVDGLSVEVFKDLLSKVEEFVEAGVNSKNANSHSVSSGNPSKKVKV